MMLQDGRLLQRLQLILKMGNDFIGSKGAAVGSSYNAEKTRQPLFRILIQIHDIFLQYLDVPHKHQ
ncbi:hypothetical protein D3C73_1581020 [compost metagenome]